MEREEPSGKEEEESSKPRFFRSSTEKSCLGIRCTNSQCNGLFCPASGFINLRNLPHRLDQLYVDLAKRLDRMILLQNFDELNDVKQTDLTFLQHTTAGYGYSLDALYGKLKEAMKPKQPPVKYCGDPDRYQKLLQLEEAERWIESRDRQLLKRSRKMGKVCTLCGNEIKIKYYRYSDCKCIICCGCYEAMLPVMCLNCGREVGCYSCVTDHSEENAGMEQEFITQLRLSDQEEEFTYRCDGCGAALTTVVGVSGGSTQLFVECHSKKHKFCAACYSKFVDCCSPVFRSPDSQLS